MEKLHDPLVTCQFYGQLGNQLFIIATTLSYAWDYKVTPIFPGLNIVKNRTSYNKERLFFRLDTSPSPRQLRNVFREKLWYRWEKIPYHPDLILDGYFQSWKYFNHYRDKILSVFAPTDLTLNKLNKKYEDLIFSPKTVGVHVRTSGKLMHEKGVMPFLGLEYYRTSMNEFPDDTLFVIFSDRINWCKKHFPYLKKNFVFIEGNDGIEDLFLMAKMRHNIIANSTYSWWAAYLNDFPNKRILAPDSWCGDPPPPRPPIEYYLPGWEIIPVPPTDPYPEDMYLYDETQSADGNW